MSRLRETASAVAVALQNEDVRRAELAWGASTLAEWAYFVALGVFAYRSGGTTAVGIAGLVRLLPAALAAPLAASFADRFRREHSLIVVLLGGAAALAGSAAADAAGTRAGVFALAALVGLSSTLVRPALQALLPSLARTPAELIASNAATSTVESLGTLAGPLAAGLLVDLTSVGVVMAAAAVLSLTGALVLVGLRVEGWVAEPRRDTLEGAARRSWAGVRAMAETPASRLVLGLMTAQTFVRGCLNVLIVVAVFRVLHANAATVGYLTAAVGAGGLAGALRGMTLRTHRLARPFALALVGWGAPIALIATRNELALAIVLLAVVGFANSVEDVAGFTLVQRAIADADLNRVLGAFWGLAMGAVALGSLAAPGLVRLVGPRAAFVLIGSLLPLATLATYRSLIALDRLTAPNETLGLIDRVALFAPLSLATKERLAARLISVAVDAGERIIRAGDAGDRFYLVDSGTVEIQAGNDSGSLGPGDFFGEIALLRDVPRTATVTASTPARLYALERADFLAAVANHERASRLGHQIASDRLG